jgi:Tol biopolymer transport system component
MNLRNRLGSPALRRRADSFEKLTRKLGYPVDLGLNTLRFCLIDAETGIKTWTGRPAIGSGHPTLTPDGSSILTDAYVDERAAFGDGSVPIRLVDCRTGTERCLVRIATRPAYRGPRSEWRVDPHPAWHSSGRWLAFNAAPEGRREVFIADMSGITA